MYVQARCKCGDVHRVWIGDEPPREIERLERPRRAVRR